MDLRRKNFVQKNAYKQTSHATVHRKIFNSFLYINMTHMTVVIFTQCRVNHMDQVLGQEKLHGPCMGYIKSSACMGYIKNTLPLKPNEAQLDT